MYLKNNIKINKMKLYSGFHRPRNKIMEKLTYMLKKKKYDCTLLPMIAVQPEYFHTKLIASSNRFGAAQSKM